MRLDGGGARSGGTAGILRWSGIYFVAVFGVGVGLRGMTVAEVFGDRDPVSGTVYYALVALMALAPWALARKAEVGGRRGRP
jgi:hypothetical protein